MEIIIIIAPCVYTTNSKLGIQCMENKNNVKNEHLDPLFSEMAKYILGV